MKKRKENKDGAILHGKEDRNKKSDVIFVKKEGKGLAVFFQRNGEPIYLGASKPPLSDSKVILDLSAKGTREIIDFIIFLNNAFVGRVLENIETGEGTVRVVFGSKFKKCKGGVENERGCEENFAENG